MNECVVVAKIAGECVVVAAGLTRREALSNVARRNAADRDGVEFFVAADRGYSAGDGWVADRKAVAA